MRPNKYPHLGELSIIRMPTVLHSGLIVLLTELNRAAELGAEPDALLADLCDTLAENNDARA